MIPVEFRQACDDDKNFILNSWLRDLQEYRSGEFINTHNNKKIIIKQGFFGAFMPYELFYKRFRPIIEERIFPKSNIIIAHNPEFIDQIYGYIVSRQRGDVCIISYCYVKLPFRKFGIGKSLFEIVKGKTNVSTVHVPWLDRVYRKQGIIFDPFFDLEE